MAHQKLFILFSATPKVVFIFIFLIVKSIFTTFPIFNSLLIRKFHILSNASRAKFFFQ